MVLRPGERWGRYEVGERLGRGGQGEVYAAWLHLPGGGARPVALKVLVRGDGLQREARLGGLLRHPHLVDVFEVGERDGRWFCAMELCAGGSLAPLAPLSPRAVVEVGLQVADALQYAHEELGLVHLDLKPANLLLHEGAVKVADLGVARAEGFEGAGAAGTRGYAAPEQLAGGAVDARTDVHALGVTLRVLATGVGPAAASTWSDAPEAPEERPPDPPWLAAIVARCTAPDPEDRFPSMAALAEALRAVEVGGPSLAELAPPSRAPAPRLVAADAFVGRRAELEDLLRRLERPGVVALKGPAGVGKTRLAQQVAARWAARGRPAWVCRVDGDLLRAVGAALDVPLRTSDPEALATRLGHALAARGEALLVLDDASAADGARVAAWAAGAPELRVLTCGREGAGAVELDVLPADDARALLVARAAERGAEVPEEVAHALVRRLDGLPLAVELAAGRMGVLSPAEVLERLGLDLLRGEAGSARRSLDASWNVLGPRERRALARLSVFEGAASVEAVEAVAGLDAVGALVDRSLLRRADDGRFELLSVVRAYAAERLEERADSEAAHGAWFAARCSPRDLALLDAAGGAARRRALARELPDLVAAARRSAARGDEATARAVLAGVFAITSVRGPYALLAQLVDELPGLFDAPILANAYLLAGRRAEAIAVARAAEPRADVLVALAAVLVQDGRPEEAREAMGRAATFPMDAATEVRLRVTRSHLLVRAGALDEAEAECAAGVARAVAAGNRRREGEACVARAGVASVRGHLDGMAAEARRAIEAGRDAGDDRVELQARLILGQSGPWEERGEHLAAALAASRAIGERRGEAIALARLGALAAEEGRVEEGLLGLDRALAVHREGRDRRDEGLVLGIRGDLLLHLGRSGEARAAYAEALAARREVGETSLPWVVGGLAAAEAADGRLEEAEAHAREALAMALASGDGGGRGVAEWALGRVLLARGDVTGAVARLRPAAAAFLPGRAARYAVTVRADLVRALRRAGDLEGAAAAEVDLRAAAALLPDAFRDAALRMAGAN